MKVIKNYLYNAGYQIFIMILPLVTVPYISRVLGSIGVGINAYTNSIIQFFILFGSMGINLYGNRTIAYCRDDKDEMSQSFWEIALLRLFFMLISYFLFLLFLLKIDKYNKFYLYQSVSLLAVGIDISWFYMGLEDFKKTVTRNTVVKILSLILVFIFVKEERDLGKYILIMNFSVFFGNLTLWSYIRRIIVLPKKKLNLIKHVRPAVSLFIPQIATQIYLILNKTMLGSIIGVESSGFYENSDKLVKIVLAVVTATGTVMLPRIANIYSQGNNDKIKELLYTSFDFVSSICFPLSFGLAAIAPKFCTWFFGVDFAITGKIVPILSVVIILIGWSNVLGTQYLLPTNQTKLYTISVSLGAITNLFCNILLIRLFGVFGAAIATIISEMTVTFSQIYFIRNQLSLKKIFEQKWKYLLASIIMWGIVSYFNQSMKIGLFYFGLQIILGVLTYVICLLILNPPIINQLKKFLKFKF